MEKNFRYYEDWMQKNCRVSLPNNNGTLVSFTTSVINDRKVILTALVLPDGCQHPFPFSPWDLDEETKVLPTARPFPETIGCL